jgi:hypothetical protein
LKAAAKLHPEARVYTDWHELLKAEHSHLDSVNVTETLWSKTKHSPSHSDSASGCIP